MRSALSWCCAFVMLIAQCGIAAAMGEDGDAPPFNAEELLKGPDRKDFSWDAWTSDPYLTWQQRNLVAVRATINCGRLQNRNLPRDMHFVVKVATADGKWDSDSSYTRIHVAPELDKGFLIQYVSGLYLRPGRYVIALIAYDDLLKKHNIRRKPLLVPRLKKDPLPELDRDLPDVEFIAEAPDLYHYKNYFYQYGHPGWPPGGGKEYLPVKSNSFICMDIIANTSVDADYVPGFRGGVSSPYILQVSSVLSHLGLQNGRIRVSVLDALRKKTFYDRETADRFDWEEARKLVAAQNPDAVDTRLLDPKYHGFDYLVEKLQEIMRDDACTAGAVSPTRIVILVTGGMDVPRRRRQPVPKAIQQKAASNRFLCFMIGGQYYDNLFKRLKQVHLQPQKFSELDPLLFRKRLAGLISGFEKTE